MNYYCACVHDMCVGQRTTLWRRASPSTFKWGLVIEFRKPSLYYQCFDLVSYLSGLFTSFFFKPSLDLK